MNHLIKKLRSCRYSKAPEAPKRGEPFHTTRHSCDHPEMKTGWKLDHCGGCKFYEGTPKPETTHAPVQ